MAEGKGHEGNAESLTEWVKCFYGAFNRRDWEWIAAMLAPEVTWFHAARDESVLGADAVVSLFQSSLTGYADAQIRILDVHATRRFVIAECSYGADQPTFCEVFLIQKGRCVRGNTYADSVRTVMELSVAPRAA